MALPVTGKIKGGFTVPLYVQLDTWTVGKDREFAKRLEAERDGVLDRIDAVNRDASLDPEAALLDESERAERRAARTDLLGPLEAKRDNINERLAEHPNGAAFIVVKVLARADKTSEPVPAPEWDAFKFREARFVEGAIFYRNDPAAPAVRVAIEGSDPQAWAFALLKSLPQVGNLPTV